MSCHKSQSVSQRNDRSSLANRCHKPRTNPSLEALRHATLLVTMSSQCFPRTVLVIALCATKLRPSTHSSHGFQIGANGCRSHPGWPPPFPFLRGRRRSRRPRDYEIQVVQCHLPSTASASNLVYTHARKLHSRRRLHARRTARRVLPKSRARASEDDAPTCPPHRRAQCLFISSNISFATNCFESIGTPKTCGMSPSL